MSQRRPAAVVCGSCQASVVFSDPRHLPWACTACGSSFRSGSPGTLLVLEAGADASDPRDAQVGVRRVSISSDLFRLDDPWSDHPAA